jgi:hypothetical protein
MYSVLTLINTFQENKEMNLERASERTLEAIISVS